MLIFKPLTWNFMEDLRHDLEHIVTSDRILDSELWREIYARDAS